MVRLTNDEAQVVVDLILLAQRGELTPGVIEHLERNAIVIRERLERGTPDDGPLVDQLADILQQNLGRSTLNEQALQTLMRVILRQDELDAFKRDAKLPGCAACGTTLYNSQLVIRGDRAREIYCISCRPFVLRCQRCHDRLPVDGIIKDLVTRTHCAECRAAIAGGVPDPPALPQEERREDDGDDGEEVMAGGPVDERMPFDMPAPPPGRPMDPNELQQLERTIEQMTTRGIRIPIAPPRVTWDPEALNDPPPIMRWTRQEGLNHEGRGHDAPVPTTDTRAAQAGQPAAAAPRRRPRW